MKKTLSSLAVAAAALFAAQAVLAQSPTRAEVKKETAEANKAGAIPGTGTGPSANVTPPISAKSDTPRADVKKETAAANKAGADPGHRHGPVCANMGETSPKQKVATSTTTRDVEEGNRRRQQGRHDPGHGHRPQRNVEPAKK